MSVDGSLDHLKDDLSRGIDLFNRSRFFEAHEALEDVWGALSESEFKFKSNVRPDDSPENRRLRLHLQALTQVAVAFHHQSTGNVVGASSVLERALRNLHGAEHSFPDLDVDRLRADSRLWLQYLKACAVERASQNTGPKIPPPLPKIVRRSREAAK